jgi:hypothetical protein
MGRRRKFERLVESLDRLRGDLSTADISEHIKYFQAGGGTADEAERYAKNSLAKWELLEPKINDAVGRLETAFREMVGGGWQAAGRS